MKALKSFIAALTIWYLGGAYIWWDIAWFFPPRDSDGRALALLSLIGVWALVCIGNAWVDTDWED